MSASQRIWDLICGYPSPRRSNAALIVLKAYLDASGSGAKDVLVMAGYIAFAGDWAKFSDEWQRLLNLGPPHYRRLDYFHMCEINLSNSAEVERCKWLYKTIEKHALVAVSCTIDAAGLDRAFESFPWPDEVRRLTGFKRTRNPYMWAFKKVMDTVYEQMPNLLLEGPLEVIFDEQSEMDAALSGWRALLEEAPKAIRDTLPPMPLFQNDKQVLPLQAADLYAWWIRKWELENDQEKLHHPTFPWGQMGPLGQLYIRLDEAHFVDAIARMVASRQSGPSSGQAS